MLPFEEFSSNKVMHGTEWFVRLSSNTKILVSLVTQSTNLYTALSALPPKWFPKVPPKWTLA